MGIGEHKTVAVRSKKHRLEIFVNDGTLEGLTGDIHYCELKKKVCEDEEYGLRCHHHDLYTIQ